MTNPSNFITKDGASDADLMRSARDMYEALKAFVAYHSTLRGDEETRRFLEAQGRSALVKARGLS